MKKQFLLGKLSAVMAAIALSIPATSANPITFAINDSKDRDVVSFTSDAPIELIVGSTSKINGQIVIDDSLNLKKTPLEAKFDVDLATIDTGIPLRNEHMRNNFLETPQYPKATFKMKSLNGPAVLAVNKPTKIMATGDFTLHGKTVTKVVPVTITYLKKCAMTEAKMPGCDLLQIKSTFSVPFADHNIKRPEVVFQKLADTVIVTVSATAWYKNPSKAVAPAKDGKKPS